MNIQTVIEHSDSYVINGHTTVVKGSGHRFLQEIENWIAQGNTPEPYTPPQPTQEQIDAQRQQAYQAEADPLFFKWQRGQATEQEWLDKIAEIKQRYPDVQENT